MVDFAKIRHSVNIGKQAREELKPFLDAEMDSRGFTAEDKVHAWREILNEAFGRSDTDNRLGVTPMTYDEARRYYHNHEITFGKFKGNKLDEVPVSYLNWLNNQPDFRRDLFRFMESPFAKSQALINEHADNRQDDAGFDSPPGY